MTTSVAPPVPDPDEPSSVPCRRHDPDMWFAESPVLLERAKELCRACPLRAECLDGALTRREPWGVWGGDIIDHGVVLPSKRGRGRPRTRPPEPGPDEDEP